MAWALRFATLATPFGKNQQYSQRYEPSTLRYAAKVAMDAEQIDADEEGDERDADKDYEPQEEEVFFAGAEGNVRGR